MRVEVQRAAVREGVGLEAFTIAWMVIEAVIAIGAGRGPERAAYRLRARQRD